MVECCASRPGMRAITVLLPGPTQEMLPAGLLGIRYRIQLIWTLVDIIQRIGNIDNYVQIYASDHAGVSVVEQVVISVVLKALFLASSDSVVKQAVVLEVAQEVVSAVEQARHRGRTESGG